MKKSIIACSLLLASLGVSAQNTTLTATCTIRPTGTMESTQTVTPNPPGSCFGWDATLTRSMQYGDYTPTWWSKTGNLPHGVQLETGKTFANPITSARSDRPSNVITKPQ